MIHFQGSGFSVELPEDCTDASAYTFLLPTPPNSAFTPCITIRSENATSSDLESYVRGQHAELRQSVEKFSLVSFTAGQHQGLDVVVATMEWGPMAVRIRQVQAHYLVLNEKQNKIYCLTGLDLKSHFDQTQHVFNTTLKTFLPNDLQVLQAAS